VKFRNTNTYRDWYISENGKNVYLSRGNGCRVSRATIGEDEFVIKALSKEFVDKAFKQVRETAAAAKVAESAAAHARCPHRLLNMFDSRPGGRCLHPTICLAHTSQSHHHIHAHTHQQPRQVIAEISTHRWLDLPCVPPLRDVAVFDAAVYLVFPYAGRKIDALIKKPTTDPGNRAFNLVLVAAAAKTMLEALTAIHQREHSYNDMKPAQLVVEMVGGLPRVSLVDMGGGERG